jgi:hypothetical protein
MKNSNSLARIVPIKVGNAAIHLPSSERVLHLCPLVETESSIGSFQVFVFEYVHASLKCLEVWIASDLLGEILSKIQFKSLRLSTSTCCVGHHPSGHRASNLVDRTHAVVVLNADWRFDPQAILAAWDISKILEALEFDVEVMAWDEVVENTRHADQQMTSPLRSSRVSLPEPKWSGKRTSRVMAELPRKSDLKSISLAEARKRLSNELQAAFR